MMYMVESCDSSGTIASCRSEGSSMLDVNDRYAVVFIGAIGSFHELLSLTGLVLTKLDGDARGENTLETSL